MTMKKAKENLKAARTARDTADDADNTVLVLVAAYTEYTRAMWELNHPRPKNGDEVVEAFGRMIRDERGKCLAQIAETVGESIEAE